MPRALVVELASTLLRRFEGLELAAYADPASRMGVWLKLHKGQAYTGPLDDGKPWTIGYGATGPDINPGVVWTRAQAEADLARRVGVLVDRVGALVKRPTADGAVAALVSLAYNIGCPKPCLAPPPGEVECGVCRFRRSSTLRLLNDGSLRAAGDAFLLWDKAQGSVNAGLLKRRTAERLAFLTALGVSSS